MSVFLQDDHVQLRKLSVNDNLNNYLSFVNETENLRWVEGIGRLPLNHDDVAKFIRDHDGLLLSIFNQAGEHVGNLQFTWINHINGNAQFGALVGRRFSGQGYAFAACRLALIHAFEVLNLHRVFLTVISGNTAAIRLWEKLGFQREGIERDCHRLDGRYYDGIRYSMLEDEYRLLRGNW